MGFHQTVAAPANRVVQPDLRLLRGCSRPRGASMSCAACAPGGGGGEISSHINIVRNELAAKDGRCGLTVGKLGQQDGVRENSYSLTGHPFWTLCQSGGPSLGAGSP